MNSPTSSPRIGLALGSGASRGWSHIGVIKALVREGIEPDVVCGTSVGAMIGGSYVAGNLENLENWVLGSTRSDVLRFFDIKLSQSGFVDTKRLNWFLHSYVAAEDQRIEDTSKKYAAVSTNLETGREVWFTEGKLVDAVRASMALPGLFPAVRNDQRWLVDGGLVNPVPVTACRALGADIVIAVNLNSGIIGKRNSGDQKAAPIEEQGALSSFKQQAKEYSNSIFPNRDKKNVAPVCCMPSPTQSISSRTESPEADSPATRRTCCSHPRLLISVCSSFIALPKPLKKASAVCGMG